MRVHPILEDATTPIVASPGADNYWRATNYLPLGQIYLYANPLLKQPLKLAHLTSQLLGHWGTSPGLNFIYVHLNRFIEKRASTEGTLALDHERRFSHNQLQSIQP